MKKTTNKRWNQKGYALIVACFFLAIVLALSTSEIYVSSSIALRDVNIQMARQYTEMNAITAAAPIMDDVDKQVMTLVQQSVMDHIAKAKLGTTYQCQDGPSSGEADLNNHFALCDPVHVLSSLDGAKNQSMNDLDAFLPDYKAHANDPKYQQMARFMENSYEYSLTPIFVGEELVDPGGKSFKVGNGSAKLPRQERYRFLVRANITMHGYEGITWRLRANYDVILSTQLQTGGVGSFGDTCDMQDMNAGLDLDQPIITYDQQPGPDGKPLTIACDETNGTCLGMGIYDSAGNFYPAGDPMFNQVCGSDGKLCTGDLGVLSCQSHAATVGTCGLQHNNNYTFSVLPMSHRRRGSYRGCVGQNTSKNQLGGIFRLNGPASIKAGSAPNQNRLSGGSLPVNSKIAAKDGKSSYGYTFDTVIKLVSVGNPYD